MENGPTKVLMHEYWYEFRAELWELFHHYYPDIHNEDYIPYIRQIFPNKKGESFETFYKYLTTVPGRDVEFKREALKWPKVNEPQVDITFINNYVIGMHMAMKGESLEGLPLVSTTGLSQKSVAQELEKLPLLFSKSKQPIINSEKTLVFAKLLHKHLQLFVSGQLDAGSVLLNKVVKSKIPGIRKQSIILLTNITEYERSLIPLIDVKKKLYFALTNRCVWLQGLEELLVVEIHKLERQLLASHNGLQQDETDRPSTGWFSNISLPNIFTRAYWLDTPIIKEGESIKHDLTTPILQKSKLLDILVDKLEAIIVKGLPLDVMKHGHYQETSVLNRADEIIDNTKVVSQLKMIVRALQAFYHTLEFMMDNIHSLDEFSLIYFKHVDATYLGLKQRLVGDIQDEHHETRHLFSSAMGLVPLPTMHKQAWYDHFEPHFKRPEAICQLFGNHQQSLVSNEQKETSSVLSQFLSKFGRRHK